MDLEAGLDGVSMIAVGAYLAAVFYHGNVSQLPPLVMDTVGYLEFLAAAGVLYGLYQWKDGRPIVATVIGAGLLAVIIKMAENSSGAAAKFEAFGKGQLTLFGLVKSLLQ